VPKDSPGRIPTLDGLRAISIALVLFGHVMGTGAVPMIPHTGMVAVTGVRTFFVISGFLITTLLLREREKHGRISLRGFYWRRAFRIFPPFYVYLAVVGVLCVLELISVSGRDFTFAATYTMNFHEHRAWWLGHLWSLAVEEQFYLIWPLTLVLFGARRAVYVAVVAILAAPVLRVAAWYGWPSIGGLTDQAFPFVFDALATGCLLALLRPELEANALYRAVVLARWFWIIPMLCVGSLVWEHPWFELGLSTSAANIGIALAVHRCVWKPDGLVGRALERPLPVFIGTLSYSLYLWQQLFVNRHAHAWWCQFPANIGFAGIVALLSYFMIEKPALRLGRRLMR